MVAPSVPDGPGHPAEGRILWEPSRERRSQANLSAYLRWLGRTAGHSFDSYGSLWRWSVEDLTGFWGSLWQYFAPVAHAPWTRVVEGERMPGVRWFPGVRLNYAEQALRRRDGHPAVLFRNESGETRTITYAELNDLVARAAYGLTTLGVQPGDRVAAYLPNLPETVVAFLATAKIGAVWSVCAPEFGTASVLERFRQIEPRVLLAVDGYRYNGRAYDRTAAVAEIRAALPTLAATVRIRNLAAPEGGNTRPAATGATRAEEPQTHAGTGGGPVVDWEDLLGRGRTDGYEPVAGEHPLWILYSSGTTGLPKAIVHSHAGIVMEHLKGISLHVDIRPEDRFFWFTTTGWMMWNFLVGGLMLGCTVVLYDGSPSHPDMGALWRMAGELGVTYFGTSAPYLQACAKAGIEPARLAGLERLKAVGSTGAPLPAEGFEWVYGHVKGDLLLGSVSGGTDVCSVFVGSCPTEPVRAGEIQCRWLGARVEAFDDRGRPVTDEVGELVVTAPLPSMPIRFWNDPDGARYRASYFETFPGVWRHGDWIRLTPRGSCVIYGRSDATLKRSGTRMGTSEFYRVVEALPEIEDSLVVDTAGLDGDDRLWLFVVLRPGTRLDAALLDRLRQTLRDQLSPRCVPDEVHALTALPHTLNGKRLEVPVKRILSGMPVERAVSPGAVDNLEALRALGRFAAGGRGAAGGNDRG